MSEILTKKSKNLILENISNENFGVAELAEELSMSRSTLLRKIQKETGISASQFIRKTRLDESIKLLKDSQNTISEISFQVGFNSTSYFIKCFKEEFGYPPGEYQKLKEGPQEIENSEEKPLTQDSSDLSKHPTKSKMPFVWISIFISVVIALSIYFANQNGEKESIDKSIAVLPFINDSKDSSNVYVVNGLMDAILNNLQKIKDLRVVSRTSVEKYRNSEMSIAEIAQELGVTYFVEGSGQKVGNHILLNIQLIDASNDRHIWAEQYDRELVDIFEIQKEVAAKIAGVVEVKITPEEQKRIEDIPTKDMVAYDFFLQGLDLLYQEDGEKLLEAITLFTKATERDPEFARAFAAIAMAYYYLDIFRTEKQYVEQVHYHAEKAFLIDPQLPQSLVAKAFSYMMKQDYETAITYLEKALDYHPNSAFVLKYLAEFYTNHHPNTEKYLEYSLKGLQVEKGVNDSSANSFMYLHVSNSFMQTGFLDEALLYINLSLDYNPKNIYSQYVKAYIEYAKDMDLNVLQNKLLEVLKMDSTRIDVVQEVAKTYYLQDNYEIAYLYYKALLNARKKYNLSLFIHENVKMAIVYRDLGYLSEADSIIQEYKDYSENNQTEYKNLLISGYYAYQQDDEKAMEYLQEFSMVEDFHYWTLYLPNEPHFKHLIDKPEFKEIMKKLETNFWQRHDRIREKLEKEGLI